eukprot:11716911-Alexandrium_andersonii.AAC.1
MRPSCLTLSTAALRSRQCTSRAAASHRLWQPVRPFPVGTLRSSSPATSMLTSVAPAVAVKR